MRAGYNDIQPWRYGDLCKVFGGETRAQAHEVRTTHDMELLLSDGGLVSCNTLQLVEVHMRMDDAPAALMRTIAYERGRNDKSPQQ